MILTELPDLPPRPETAANAAFRRDYVARWTRENTLLCGASRFAEYPAVVHPLSIKMAWGGPEVYHLGRRDVRVGDGSWLVLNDGERYGSTLRSERPAMSFSIFLRRGLAGEVLAAQRLGLDKDLDRGAERLAPAANAATFSPHLRSHDGHVAPRMRFIHARVMAGERSQDWLDEQAVLLVGDLVAAEHEAIAGTLRLPASKASTRAELSRRLRLAADHIESNYDQPLPLEALARIACMSSFHFLRYFALLHGTTPHAYVLRCRTAAARRMRADGIADAALIARRCGFGSRSSLYRALGERRQNEAMPKRATSGGLVYSTDAGRMCPTCRQPLASCTCGTAPARVTPPGDGIARIRREVGGRGGKTVTVVAGLPLDEVALAALAKRLKSACGTGGTVKAGVLEFQGDHRDQLVALLAREGFRSKLAGG